ncbi:valine--tRNA ligase [Vallitalea pronyensis]|uniref:Valine--tRNA ligase n=1 Tax=Vallitalea pronyensis TaxID=1348613 RepID=A0A8J8SGL0_9FIRM|nr:valine--tRNA ligase [Vallitalea pronyensis]QUI22467.1 valine--tRNA ligase [Vallitalea pronyensis]
MLSKKYKPSETEAKLSKFWESNQIYTFHPEDSGDIYSIDTPPPTVSGKLHIGHIFSYTQAEMIARYKRMQGYNVFYPFGFDDNGLPTERLVENDLKIQAKDIPRSVFTQKCYQVVEAYEQEFQALWHSLGFSCDWNLVYRTIEPRTQRISQKSFIDLYKQNKAYLEESPVLYCTHCQTSIAQAELESKELDTTFNHIPFMVDGQVLEIATTRPELLYACQAIFVHPEDTKNAHWIGKKAQVPLYDFTVPILADQDVDMHKGSGMVMCCTFGDTKDLEWYKTYSFDYKKAIDIHGFMAEEVPYIGGMHVKKARQRIIELLTEQNLLIKKYAIQHTVSVHERCGHPIEIMPSKQWYIDILTHKDTLLALADHINWYPSYMKTRYTTWVENLKWNWCISRQRYFGVPFPVWYCEKCGAIMVADETALPVNPLETAPPSPCSCGSTDFRPESAVLDTWATSSVTPLINARYGEPDDMTDQLLPMSMRTQAHEIIRTWAFYTMAKTYFHFGIIPWKDIMICGFVLARKGEKISKSKKNAKLEPKKLIETHSADCVRYWAASAKLGTDTTFSEDDLKVSKRFITKLWNAAKFSLMHLEDWEPCQVDHVLPQDQWILDRSRLARDKASQHLDQYEIGLARQVLDSFFWHDYCDHYLELVKDRLYKPDVHGKKNRQSAQYAIYHTLLTVLKAYSIFTPFITEEIYKAYYETYESTPSIHLTKWQKATSMDTFSIAFGDYLKMILSDVRKYKSEKALSMKDAIGCLTLTIPEAYTHAFEGVLQDLYATTHAERIVVEVGDDFELIMC